MSHCRLLRRMALALACAAALMPLPALAGGKLSLYATRIEPNGADAKKFSSPSWGGGLAAVVPLSGTQNLLAFTGGLEGIHMLGQTTEFIDDLTGLRVEQQTSQDYGRLFLGGRFGAHGAGFIRPHIGANLALVIYGIGTDVVIPDDSDRENEIRQNLKSETRTVFGYDFNAGVDFNIANAVPVEIGARYLKSFDVPQQLGAGSVKVSPEYFQIYFGVGLGFDFMRRIGD